MSATVGNDSTFLRTTIHQGNKRKLEKCLEDLSKRRNEIFDREFDACAYATKCKQDHLLPLLYDFGFPLDGYFNSKSTTALIIAIRRADVNAVQRLIEMGSDVNCSVRSFTIIPLLEAYQTYRNKQDDCFSFDVRCGYVNAKEIFRLLLEAGASPNVYNIHSLRLVHLAVTDGEFQILKMLLDFGANVNVVTKPQRRNLLHFICDRAQFEENKQNLLNVAQTLIQLGCDLNHRDHYFETPLMCSLHHGGNLLLAHEFILEGTDLDLKNNFGNTYLTRAVHHSLYDHARMALYAGAPCRAWQWTFPYASRSGTTQKWTNNDTALMNAIVDFEKFTKELEHYLVRPRTLKHISRLFLRKLLPCPLSKSTEELVEFLPRSLINYLLLNDMKTSLKLEF